MNTNEEEDRPLKIRKKHKTKTKNCRTEKSVGGASKIPAKSKKVKQRIKVKRDCKTCKKKFPDLIHLWDHFKVTLVQFLDNSPTLRSQGLVWY